MRGAPAAEIVPKAGPFRVLCGALRLTLLNTLKTSPRNWRVTFCSIGNDLNAERSVPTYRGPYSRLNGVLPYGMPGGGVAKAELLKNALVVAILPRPEGRCGFPMRFGRSFPVPSKFVS